MTTCTLSSRDFLRNFSQIKSTLLNGRCERVLVRDKKKNIDFMFSLKHDKKIKQKNLFQLLKKQTPAKRVKRVDFSDNLFPNISK